ncbi:MAG: hypothetical protein ACREL7_18575 [Longimicrobiales bacterium]
MKRSFILIMTALAFTLAARPVHAQLGLGAAAVWGDDRDLGVGGRAAVTLFSVPASVVRIQATGAFDYFFDCDDCTYYEITPAAVVSVGLVGIGLYAGVGANIAQLSFDSDAAAGSEDDTEVGASLIIGARVPMGLFAEIRWTSGGAGQKVIGAGFRFGL